MRTYLTSVLDRFLLNLGYCVIVVLCFAAVPAGMAMLDNGQGRCLDYGQVAVTCK